MRMQKLFAALAACGLLCLYSHPGLTQTTTTPAAVPSSDEGIQKAIHDYILAHPEVIMQSLRIAKDREQDQLLAIGKSMISSYKKELLEDPNSPVLGNPAGDVTFVEFFDYRCPYCRQVEVSVQRLMKADPGVRVIEKELPILGPVSVYAARVALAANKQGKHKEFRDAIMAKKPNVDEAAILELAKNAGLDIDRLKVDMESPEVQAEIDRNLRLAKALRLSGTPAFIVGKELIPGATDLETLEALADETRHGAGSATKSE